jgi:hypothetical protein
MTKNDEETAPQNRFKWQVYHRCKKKQADTKRPEYLK